MKLKIILSNNINHFTKNYNSKFQAKITCDLHISLDFDNFDKVNTKIVMSLWIF